MIFILETHFNPTAPSGALETDMKELTLMAALILTIAGMSFAGKFDRQEAERASSEYTEMVCLNRSNPDIGWPNYKNLNITCGE